MVAAAVRRAVARMDKPSAIGGAMDEASPLRPPAKPLANRAGRVKFLISNIFDRSAPPRPSPGIFP